MDTSYMKCIYCFTELNSASNNPDHVPPKSLFKPGCYHLITVPCCKKCNHAKGLDDEYAKQVLVMGNLIEYRPEFHSLIDSSLRALEKPNKIGFRHLMLDGAFIEPQQDSSYKASITIDEPRILRWAEQVARGIYYREFSTVIDGSFKVKSDCLNTSYGHSDEWDQICKSIIGYSRKNDATVIGDGEFMYWVVKSRKPPSASIIMCFYKEYYFNVIFNHRES
jgi:hypothetical protein